MNTKRVRLIPFSEEDREQFILDNQWAFKYGALLEFGKRDDHLNCDGEIISRKTIEQCIDAADNETYRIVVDGKKVGGVILKIDHMTGHNHLEILFTSPMKRGRPWRHFIQKQLYGKPIHHTLKKEIFISMSINAAFTSWSFLRHIMQIRRCQWMVMTLRGQTKHSVSLR